MPVEAPHPAFHRISAGRFDEGAGYHTYRKHGTDDWLLIHTVGGRGRFGTADAREFVAHPGDSVLLRPGVHHDYGVEPELRQWSILFAHFHPRAEWAPLLEWPEPLAGIMHLHSVGEVERRIVAALSEAVRHNRAPLADRELFALNSFEAALLWCDTQNPRKAGGLDERILRALDHIDAHLSEPLHVAEIARTVALSASRFAHMFTDQVGLSPSRYIEAQRMAAATQLLELTTRPVGAIAAQVGFTDPLYFSTRFRRHTGRSPQAYRTHRARSTNGI
ncbi:MAG TPA: helix-turn-helix domain-containing protein [Mycobacteriales bacterium]|nr:helix-turn-helix domain-containing protein [Mycobacteriales bacterium]